MDLRGCRSGRDQMHFLITVCEDEQELFLWNPNLCFPVFAFRFMMRYYELLLGRNKTAQMRNRNKTGDPILSQNPTFQAAEVTMA